MRKKQLWFLVLPIVLLLAIVGLQSWQRHQWDAEFQREIGRCTVLRVSYAQEGPLGTLKGREMQQVVSLLHLQPRKPQPEEGDDIWVQLHFFASESSDEAAGIFLRWDGDQNNVGYANSSFPFDKRWGKFQLTSQSRAEVLEFIWRKWGAKLRSTYAEGVISPPTLR